MAIEYDEARALKQLNRAHRTQLLLFALVVIVALAMMVMGLIQGRTEHALRLELSQTKAALLESRRLAREVGQAVHERDWARAQLQESHRDLSYCHDHAIGWQAEWNR